MRRVMNFLLGALIGGLIGALMAILMAPSSGEELRGQIQGRATRLRDELSEAAQARRIELERQLASLRQPKKESIPAEKAETAS